MTRFSVISVVRNDRTGILRTLQSVFDQTWQDYEVIVQDGASTDGTSEVLRGLGDWIDSLVIEPDRGIYDAMNRALDRARGDYLLFLNASDFLVDEGVLARVAAVLADADDIVAGQAIRDEDGQVQLYRKPDQFWAGSVSDHQACFIRREVMQEFRYREAFPISADLDFFTRARAAGIGTRHVALPIVRKPFAIGASSDFLGRLEERRRVLDPVYGRAHPLDAMLRRELLNHIERRYPNASQKLDALSLDALIETCARWNRVLAAC